MSVPFEGLSRSKRPLIAIANDHPDLAIGQSLQPTVKRQDSVFSIVSDFEPE